MGLVFALQPEKRGSTPSRLALKSTKKRFSLGSSFLFGGALLGTMYLAASPLFKVLWNEGNLFDKFLAAFFYTPIILYPFLTLLCWFFEEVVIIEKLPKGGFSIRAFEKFFWIKWNKRFVECPNLDLRIENWKGAINMAAISAEQKGRRDQYATRGHWILRLYHSQGSLDLERRAKKEEVEFLLAQIESYFPSPHLGTSTNAAPNLDASPQT